MEMTKEQKQKIKTVGEKFNLKLILLHGSYARNRVHLGSDLDIAILGQRPIDFKVLLEIHGELARIFGDNPQRELDLKSLDRADPLFLYQVVRFSQLLYGNPLDYYEFRAYAFRFFHDAKDLFNLERKLIDKFQKHLTQKYA